MSDEEWDDGAIPGIRPALRPTRALPAWRVRIATLPSADVDRLLRLGLEGRVEEVLEILGADR